MGRRIFSRESKLETVKLIRDEAVDPSHVFPGHGQIKPEQLEIERLRREVTKLKAERDILAIKLTVQAASGIMNAGAFLHCGITARRR
jgi:transposase-like protein|tara:strand:+ start:29 stop:292 length:264 start_codon:yes stop_codon:yes gene_type:complete